MPLVSFQVKIFLKNKFMPLVSFQVKIFLKRSSGKIPLHYDWEILAAA
jgi:hypothetical protein